MICGLTRSVAVASAADYFDSGGCAWFTLRVPLRERSHHSGNWGGAHAPDEHLLAPLARQALQLMAALFWDLGERLPPQGPTTR